MWHQGGRLLRISVRSWRRARSDYHLQRWVPWRTERWTEVVHLTACPMSHICGICVMHQCHVQHAKFMPGHVGFVFFPNKIETKHDDSTTIKKYINRPFGPSVWFCFWSRTPRHVIWRLFSNLGSWMVHSLIRTLRFNSFVTPMLWTCSRPATLQVVEQCGDGVAGSQTVSYILQPICEFSPWAGPVRAR